MALDAQAQRFFGDEQYRLDGDIEVNVLEETGPWGGAPTTTTWQGDAWYVNLR